MVSADRIRVIAISDFHAGRPGRIEFVNQAFSQILQKRPDVVLLAGDFIDKSLDDARMLAPQLRRMRDRGIPLVGVLGNHDHWVNNGEGTPAVKTTLQEGGVTLLDGNIFTLEKKGQRLDILGIEGYSEASEAKNGKGVYRDRRALPGKTIVESELTKLRRGLARLRGNHNIVLMHYAPGNDDSLQTLDGEKPSAKPLLGSKTFFDAILRHNTKTAYPVENIIHGHADFGYPSAEKPGINIFNVSSVARGRRNVVPYQVIDLH